MKIRGILLAGILAIAPASSMTLVSAAQAASPRAIDRDATSALRQLYRTNPAAEAISKKAKAILIFPKIVKGGLIIGGAFGEGELKQGSRVEGYYNSVTGSWGLQAGAQSYGYVVFLMNDKALNALHSNAGWEIGVGPTVVLVDAGVARNLSTTTLNDDAYAFIFDQHGLMAGVSLEGTKVTHIKENSGRNRR